MNPDERAEKLQRQVVDALDRLPNTADGIAAYFAEVGIKGKPSESQACPLANYLCAEVEALQTVTVGGTVVVRVYEGGTFVYANHDGAHIEFSDRSLSDFVGRFDSKQYPHLIEGAR